MEQSCRAALSEQEYERAFAAQKRAQKNAATCAAEIQNCLNADRRCGTLFVQCEENADLDKYFSECLAAAGGCDAFSSGIRPQITSLRDGAFASKQTVMTDMIAAYQSARVRRLSTIKNGCADDSLKESCVLQLCSTIGGDCMNDAARKSAATRMCAYVDTACGRIK
jgi:hypothetical protein